MKRKALSVFLLSFLVISISLGALSVEREVIEDYGGSDMKVRISISSSKSQSFDVIEFTPTEVKVSDWETSGIPESKISYESKPYEYMGKKRKANNWEIEDFEGEGEITYYFNPPSEKEGGEFVLISAHEGGFNTNTENINYSKNSGMPSFTDFAGEDGRLWIWMTSLIAIVISISIGIYYYLMYVRKGKETSKESKSEKITEEEPIEESKRKKELREYVKQALQNQVDPSILRNRLISVGWNRKLVSELINEVSKELEEK